MPKITREDGINFIIPSYRYIFTVKSKKAFQNEVISLGKSYGEYLALQRKAQMDYEVAFATESGYLLGETVWQFFDRPAELIYCEAIPNTAEAILVIVKESTVYLDGIFPLDSIQDELLVFLTQQNRFEIYVHGDVPISEKPEEGKFSFDANSVASFKILDEPAFKKLPLIPNYQLKLIDVTLAEHGIGVIPIKQYAIILLPIIGIVVLVMAVFSYQPEEKEVVMEPNPYQAYVDAMVSPDPENAVSATIDNLELIYGAPGWNAVAVKYDRGSFEALMISSGNSIEALMKWADEHNFNVTIRQQGVYLTANLPSKTRPKPKVVYPLKESLAVFIDRLSKVYPGNNVALEANATPSPVVSYVINLKISERSPMGLRMIAKQMHDLPLTIDSITLATNKSLLDGKIVMKIMGN